MQKTRFRLNAYLLLHHKINNYHKYQYVVIIIYTMPHKINYAQIVFVLREDIVYLHAYAHKFALL